MCLGKGYSSWATLPTCSTSEEHRDLPTPRKAVTYQTVGMSQEAHVHHVYQAWGCRVIPGDVDYYHLKARTTTDSALYTEQSILGIWLIDNAKRSRSKNVRRILLGQAKSRPSASFCSHSAKANSHGKAVRAWAQVPHCSQLGMWEKLDSVCI